MDRRQFITGVVGSAVWAGGVRGRSRAEPDSNRVRSAAASSPSTDWEWVDDGDGIVQAFASTGAERLGCVGYEAADGTQDVLLRGIDHEGEGVWSETIGGDDEDAALDAVATEDRGIVFCGGSRSLGSSGIATVVGRFDPPDSLEWFTPYGRSGADDAAHAIVPASADGFVVAGGTHYLGGAFGDGVGRLVAIDGDGSLRWDETYETAYAGECYDVVRTGTDEYAFAGTRASPGGGRAWLGVVDGDGDRRWSETYGEGGSRIAYAVTEAHDGGFVLAGTTASDGGGIAAWLGGVDAAGTLEWQETYGTSGDDAAVSIERAPEGYVVAGWTGGFAWLLRVDAEGSLRWEETYGTSGDDALDRFNALSRTEYGYAAGGFTTESGASPSAWAVGVGSEPSIDAASIEFDRYAVESGGRHPTISVEVERASAVELDVIHGGTTRTIPLEHVDGDRWQTTVDLDAALDPGTWVDLELAATAGDRRDAVDSFGNEYVREGSDLGYFVFEEVFDVAVVLGRFENHATDLVTTSVDDFRRWLESWRIDVNRYYGSGRGSMGAVGFHLTHFHDDGAGYEIDRESHYRSFDVRAGRVESLLSDDPLESPRGSEILDDLRDEAAADVDVDEYDFWIGRHFGPSVLDIDRFFGSDGVIKGYLSPETTRIYAPFLPDENEPTDYAFFYDTLLHEIGHAYGLHHLYNKGDVQSECLMGASSSNYPDGVRGSLIDAPPCSTALRIGEYLDLDLTDLNPVTDDIDDWLTVEEIALDELDGDGRAITVPALDEYRLGDDVTVVDTDGDRTGPNTYVVETRPFVEGYEDGSVRWTDEPSGAVVIYRHFRNAITGDVSYNVVTESRFWEEDERYLLETGDRITDRIGARSPLRVEFELESESIAGDDREATVRTSLGPGDANTRAVTLRDETSTPGTFDLVRESMTVPNLDLKAVDSEGRTTGITEDGTYVNEIPDARASGKRLQGMEWIAVPDDLEVEFFVSSEDVGRFLEEVTEQADDEATAEEIEAQLSSEYAISETRYGEDPQLVERDGETVVEGATTRIDRREIDPGSEERIDPDELEPIEADEDERDEASLEVPLSPAELAGIGAVGAGMLYLAARMLAPDGAANEE